MLPKMIEAYIYTWWVESKLISLPKWDIFWGDLLNLKWNRWSSGASDMEHSKRFRCRTNCNNLYIHKVEISDTIKKYSENNVSCIIDVLPFVTFRSNILKLYKATYFYNTKHTPKHFKCSTRFAKFSVVRQQFGGVWCLGVAVIAPALEVKCPKSMKRDREKVKEMAGQNCWILSNDAREAKLGVKWTATLVKWKVIMWMSWKVVVEGCL